MNIIDRLRLLRHAHLPLHAKEPTWVLDADTFTRVLKNARFEMAIDRSLRGPTLLGHPYRIVNTEPLPETIGPAEVPTERVKPMPVLITLEYRDKVGLVRYAFDEATDERFLA